MSLAILRNKPGALPIVAQLRKGGAKRKIVKDGKEIEIVGENLKHFRLRTMANDPELVKIYDKVYAEQIKQNGGVRDVRFVLWGETVEDNYEPWKEHHVKTKLMHRCDGVVCSLWRKPDGSYSTEPIPCPGECKWTGSLSIIVPALGRPAAIEVVTTSFWDVVNLHENLTAVFSLFGTLRGVEMILRRSPRVINKPVIKDKKRTGDSVRAEEWLLSVEATPEAFAKRIKQLAEAREQIALPPAKAPLAIAGSTFAFSDAELVDEENEENDEFELMCDAETQRAIETLWPGHGVRNKNGNIMTIDEFLASKKIIGGIENLPLDLAQKTLAFLRDNALKAQHPEPPKAEPGAGLDQWACGDRALALDIIQLTEDLEKLGVTEEQWRAELAVTNGQPDDTIISRKALTFVEATAWRDTLKAWIVSKS